MSESLFLVQCAFLTCKLCTQSALINRSWPPVTACHVPPPTFYSRQGQDHHLEGQGHDQRILQRDIHYKCRASNTTTTSTGRRSEGDGCGGVGCGGAEAQTLNHWQEPTRSMTISLNAGRLSRGIQADGIRFAAAAATLEDMREPWSPAVKRKCRCQCPGAFFPVSRRQGQTSREQELHDRSQAFETIKTDWGSEAASSTRNIQYRREIDDYSNKKYTYRKIQKDNMHIKRRKASVLR